jgi:hypothetical protein
MDSPQYCEFPTIRELFGIELRDVFVIATGYGWRVAGGRSCGRRRNCWQLAYGDPGAMAFGYEAMSEIGKKRHVVLNNKDAFDIQKVRSPYVRNAGMEEMGDAGFKIYGKRSFVVAIIFIHKTKRMFFRVLRRILRIRSRMLKYFNSQQKIERMLRRNVLMPVFLAMILLDFYVPLKCVLVGVI